MIEQPMPHNIQAEQAIIGALFCDSSCRWKAKGLGMQDWYSEAHHHIAQAIQETDGTFIAACQWLNDRDLLERITPEYIKGIQDQVSISAGIDTAIETVRECSARRRFITLCYRQAEAAYNRPADETAAELKRGLGKIETAERIQIVTASQAVNEAYKEVEEAAKHDGALVGLTSGYADLDFHTGGFRPGDLIVLGARPGAGKTVFAENLAVRCKKPVLVFNLEMTARQLAARDLAGESKISFTKIRTGRIKGDEWNRLTQAAGKLSDLPIHYVDSGNLTMEDIMATAERAQKKHGIELIIVDYIQLITGQGMRKREEFVAYLSRSFKTLARELQVPILTLAQLNRLCEQRKNKRPVLSDLRESGAIEQDADVVLFLYRDAMYDERADQSKAELIISKGRNIQIGTVPLVWQGSYQRFDSQYHV